jgi:serine/threonine-protein kinase RsbW
VTGGVADVEIEIPSRSAYVAVVRLALAALTRSAGLDEEVVDDIKIAVSEACANAVMANEAARTDAPVTVAWTEGVEGLVVEVGDRGAERDPAAGAGVGPGAKSRALMSLALLQSLVDECDMVAREGGGMTAQLLFRR